MKCPKCSHEDTKVLESRLSHEGQSVRRRRSCLKCNHRFTTYEKEEEFQLSVQKKDGRFEAYNREKILSSVRLACQKRPVPGEEMEVIVGRVERLLQEDGERAVTSQRIGDLVMRALRDTDHVAYVRFASVYKDFKDPEEFVKELRSLTGSSDGSESTVETH